MQSVAAQSNSKEGEAPTQIYSATRQAWYSSVMTSSDSTLVTKFADTMKQLNEQLVHWLYSRETDGEVQSARPIDEYSVLMTASKETTNVSYYRPSYLRKHRLYLVDAGHGGTNNCLVHSIITGIAMHAKVLGIGLPTFLEKLQHVSWSTFLKKSEIAEVVESAKYLRKLAATWLSTNRKQIVQRYQWASDMCHVPAGSFVKDVAGMTADLDKEIASLNGNGFLGLLSHSAVVQAMYTLDSGWFTDNRFRIFSYGAGMCCPYPDKIIEILPWDLSKAPKYYVRTINALQLLPPHDLRRKYGLDLNTLGGIQIPTRPVQVDELTSLHFSMVVSATPVHFNTISFVGDHGHVRLDPQQTVVGVNLVSDTKYCTELPVYSQTPCDTPSDSCFHAASSYRCRAETRKASVKSRQPKRGSATQQTKVTLSDPLPQDELNTFDWGRRPDARDEADQRVLKLPQSQVQR